MINIGKDNLPCCAKEPFFSIVIPLYNCVDYIGCAIESILAQSFQDYELIIIDDCSNDNSYDIASVYANNNKKIRLLKTERKSGVSVARNIGIFNANGSYLLFVDADDYLESDILGKINNSTKEHYFDIIKFGYSIDFYDKKKLIINKVKKIDGIVVADQQEEIKSLALEMEAKQIFAYVWNTAYNAKFIKKHGILFDSSMKVNEDNIFNFDAFSMASSIAVIDSVGYHYNKRKNVSLSLNINGNNFPFYVKSIERMISFYNPSTVEASNMIRWLYTRTLYVNGCQIIFKKGCKDFWCSIFQTELFNSIYNKKKQCKISFMKDFLIKIIQTRNILLINTCCFFMLALKKFAPSIFIKIKS